MHVKSGTPEQFGFRGESGESGTSPETCISVRKNCHAGTLSVRRDAQVRGESVTGEVRRVQNESGDMDKCM